MSFISCFPPFIFPPRGPKQPGKAKTDGRRGLLIPLFHHTFSISVVDQFLIPFLYNFGPNLAPKMDPTSFKNRSKIWSYVWSHFGRAKIPKLADLGTPRTPKMSDSSTLLNDFHLFCKSSFVTIFLDFGLHFGRFWDPKLALFGDQKSIKLFINFGIDFLLILVPSWVPKWN